MINTIKYQLSWIHLPISTNSVYLLSGTAISSAFGFIFWFIAARRMDPSSIGLATAMIASLSMLSEFSNLGLGTVIVRFIADQRLNKPNSITTYITVGLLSNFLVTCIYLFGLAFWNPKILILKDHPLDVIAFIIFSISTSFFSLQVSAMLAQRRAAFAFWGLVFCNLPSALLITLVPHTIGFRPIFYAYEFPVVIFVVIANIVVLPKFYANFLNIKYFQPKLLNNVWKYSFASYLANLLWTLPGYIFPIILINRLSPEATAYFFIAWSVVNIIMAIPRAVTSSLFSEGAFDENKLYLNVIHSIRLIFFLLSPAIIIMWFFGPSILGIFGKDYVHIDLIRILLVAIVPFAINSIFFTILRIGKKNGEIILFSAINTCICVTFAYLLSPKLGIIGVGFGWLIGQATVTIIGLYIVIKYLQMLEMKKLLI